MMISEIDDDFKISFLSTFACFPQDVPPEMKASCEGTRQGVFMKCDSFYSFSCSFNYDYDRSILCLRNFVGNIGLLDTFVKKVILFFRSNSNSQDPIRFYFETEQEAEILGNLRVRLSSLERASLTKNNLNRFFQYGKYYHKYFY